MHATTQVLTDASEQSCYLENSVLAASSSVMTPSNIDLWDIADSDADDRNTPAGITDDVPQGKEMACFYREVCRTMVP